MNLESYESREEIQKRLRRIEGQLRGIQGMLENDRSCRDVVQQFNAVSAALKSASQAYVQAYARECLNRAVGLEPGVAQASLDELFALLSSAN